ncbi:MAG: hypothetical protein IZT59_05970 [Verrucomicrobia bacterium]|nr:hypothetical protein [Verrucomicrobiota bacterium]
MSLASSVKGICKSLMLLVIFGLSAFAVIFIFKLNAGQKKAIADRAFHLLSNVPGLNLDGLAGSDDGSGKDTNVQAIRREQPG